MQTYHPSVHVQQTSVYVCVVSCDGMEWSTFVRNQWISVAWYLETVSPPTDCLTYYITQAQRTIDIADDESFIACLSALNVLLTKVISIQFLSFLKFVSILHILSLQLVGWSDRMRKR